MTMDRIGNLPDEIICHIVAFLSAKEAAFATTLSKQWGNLLKIIPQLRFDDSVANTEGSFEEFVHAVMVISVTDRVRSFFLKCKHVSPLQDWEDPHNRCIRRYPQYEDHISRCLRHLVLKRGVLALKIDFAEEVNFSHRLKFHLQDNFYDETRVWFCNRRSSWGCFPSLKNLYLESVQFYAYDGLWSFQTLLSASPVLEGLVLDGLEWESWKWSRTVSSTTLRRLTIRRKDWEPEFEGIYVGGISLDTPALQYLYYSDFVHTEYPVANLNSLVEASFISIQPRFDDVCWDDYTDVYNPMNLIYGIKNVELLEVDSNTIDMFHAFRSVLPVFENLHKLYVNLYDDCWNSLQVLIGKCPNVKNFTMESLHTGRKEDRFICLCVSEYSFLLQCDFCSLEVLKIKRYRGTGEELKQMKLLMEKASSLKLVKVDAQVLCDKQLQVMADLVMLPRALTKCIIEVNFKLIVTKI